MGVDREPLGPECRQKDGSRPPGLAFAHERGTLVRHPRGPTGYKAVRRNAAQTQRGRSRYRPPSASRGEETTLELEFLVPADPGRKRPWNCTYSRNSAGKLLARPLLGSFRPGLETQVPPVTTDSNDSRCSRTDTKSAREET